jgi:glycosyltransferase involved in cell wall biosynthesis
MAELGRGSSGSSEGESSPPKEVGVRKPKLLVALNYYYPYVSGISEYARLMAGVLVDDFEITILTGKHSAELSDEIRIDDVRVFRAPLWFKLHKGYVSISFVKHFMSLAREADLICLHLPMLEGGLLAHLGVRHAPIVNVYHCDAVSVGGLVDAFAVRSVLWSARLAMGVADGLIVLTQDYARQSVVLKAFADLGVEAPLVKMEGRGLTLRSETAGNLRIGFVGRFVREKGIDVILQAIRPLIQRRPSTVFVFVGGTEDVAGGSLYNGVARELAELSEHVDMRGRLSEDELWEFYNEIDILLLPSVNSYEAFGLVQIEAMLAGALVVASDLPGVRVPIQLTGNGMLVQSRSAESLILGVQQCIELRSTRSREEVRARALQFFSNQAARKKMLQAFGEARTRWLSVARGSRQ